jgi:hypothetical protein
MSKKLTPEQERNRMLYYACFTFLQELGGDIAEQGECIRRAGTYGHGGLDMAKKRLKEIQRKTAWAEEAIERLEAEISK